MRFRDLQALASLPPAHPRKRSVLFLHNSYYHFYYLARALRRRGWDALTVSLEDPSGPNARFYHGEDVNLHSRHPRALRWTRAVFERYARRRFRLLHFAGDGCMSFYDYHFRVPDPPDIMRWRAVGGRVAYTVSGCLSCTAQTSVARWSLLDAPVAICDRCPWKRSPEVCCDERNLEWGRSADKHCDVIFSETLPALDYVASEKTIREPGTMCLDPDVWRPDLPIPGRFRVERRPGELIVYHAVGNHDLRTRGNRNIKGTHAVVEAIERLKGEGVPVRLVFVTNMRNRDVRFIQAQADVIVDQLNIGRYGANAREGMMLGVPTICYLNRKEVEPRFELRSLAECPLVSATEETIYSVLKELLPDRGRRAAIGRASREYALKWHSADACAARYERVYDRIMAGLAPNDGAPAIHSQSMLLRPNAASSRS